MKSYLDELIIWHDFSRRNTAEFLSDFIKFLAGARNTFFHFSNRSHLSDKDNNDMDLSYDKII